MSKFDERGKEFEARFKHDQEFAFKVTARRNKLLGLWAARHLGLAGAAAEAYAKEVVAADFSSRATATSSRRWRRISPPRGSPSAAAGRRRAPALRRRGEDAGHEGLRRLCRAEHAAEDRVDVFEVVGGVEQRVDRLGG